MKEKDIKHILKQKANDVYVKNDSDIVLKRFLDTQPEPSLKKKRHPILEPLLKPLIALSLSVLIVVFSFLFFQKDDLKPFDLQAHEEPIVIALLTSYYLEVTEDEHEALSLLSHIEIEDDLDYLISYFGLVEYLLKLNTQDMIRHDLQNDLTYHHMTITLTDFIEESLELEFIFYVPTKEGNQDIFEGVFIILDHEISFELIFENDQFELTTYHNQQHQTISTFQIEQDIKTYHHAIYHEHQRIKAFELIFDTTTEKTIDLNFIEGHIQGNYRFTQENHGLHIAYQVAKGIFSEEGHIIVDIITDGQSHAYGLTIRPFGSEENQRSFSKGRGVIPPKGRPDHMPPNHF